MSNIRVIHSGTHKARKEYKDNGWEIIHEWMSGGCFKSQKLEMTNEEYITLLDHITREYPWRILKGDIYERQLNDCEGDICTFRMNKKLYDIACKFDLF